MGRDQTRCDGDSETVRIEAPGWIVGFHLGLQRPADVLQLGVAYLKAISDLHATGIESVFFRDGVQQRGRKTQDESGVVLVVKLPAGGGKCRDNVDIAVHGGASVALSSSATGDLCCGAHVDGNEHTLQFGDVQDSNGIGTELQGQPVGCFAIGEDPRQPRVHCDVRG